MSTRRRLRIPAALAVAVIGTSASVAMTLAGCDSAEDVPRSVDAGQASSEKLDAGVTDAMADAAMTPQDAAPALVDAYLPPPDAPHT